MPLQRQCVHENNAAKRTMLSPTGWFCLDKASSSRQSHYLILCPQPQYRPPSLLFSSVTQNIHHAPPSNPRLRHHHLLHLLLLRPESYIHARLLLKRSLPLFKSLVAGGSTLNPEVGPLANLRRPPWWNLFQQDEVPYDSKMDSFTTLEYSLGV